MNFTRRGFFGLLAASFVARFMPKRAASPALRIDQRSEELIRDFEMIEYDPRKRLTVSMGGVGSGASSPYLLALLHQESRDFTAIR